VRAVERAGYLAHSQTPAFARRVNAALALVERMFEQAPRAYVAFSGGKDSSVVLHLVRWIRPETMAHYGHEQWVFPETEALIAATPNLVQTALPDRHAEWFSVWQDPSEVPEGVIYVDPAKGLTEWNYGHELLGGDGTFLGLRAEENSERRLHLKRHGPLFYCHRHGLWECNPIHNWSVIDVWAYIVANHVPYNAAYDRLGAMGVPLQYQRIGPLAQGRVLAWGGQMSKLKRGWPELFNRFAAAFPEALDYL
jgi:3'-phosphoadenosine 5'-phosphosulfate sulfotransferase (PAPS reductase)/FAD synthetase